MTHKCHAQTAQVCWCRGWPRGQCGRKHPLCDTQSASPLSNTGKVSSPTFLWCWWRAAAHRGWRVPMGWHLRSEFPCAWAEGGRQKGWLGCACQWAVEAQPTYSPWSAAQCPAAQHICMGAHIYAARWKNVRDALRGIDACHWWSNESSWNSQALTCKSPAIISSTSGCLWWQALLLSAGGCKAHACCWPLQAHVWRGASPPPCARLHSSVASFGRNWVRVLACICAAWVRDGAGGGAGKCGVHSTRIGRAVPCTKSPSVTLWAVEYRPLDKRVEEQAAKAGGVRMYPCVHMHVCACARACVCDVPPWFVKLLKQIELSSSGRRTSLCREQLWQIDCAESCCPAEAHLWLPACTGLAAALAMRSLSWGLPDVCCCYLTAHVFCTPCLSGSAAAWTYARLHHMLVQLLANACVPRTAACLCSCCPTAHTQASSATSGSDWTYAQAWPCGSLTLT